MQHFYSSNSSVQQKQGRRFKSESNAKRFLLLSLYMTLFFGLSLKAEAQSTTINSTNYCNGGSGSITVSSNKPGNTTFTIGVYTTNNANTAQLLGTLGTLNTMGAGNPVTATFTLASSYSLNGSPYTGTMYLGSRPGQGSAIESFSSGFTMGVTPVPTSPLSKTFVYGATIPDKTLSVTVPAGQSANWYDVSSGGTAVASNTTSFTPSATTPGTYTYYVAGLNGSCESTTRLPITLTITQKPLTITGVSAVSRAYDGGTVCSLIGTASLQGVVSGDNVVLTSTGTTGSFADRNVGTNKAVTGSGYGISGAQASYYTLTQPTLSANITPKPITIATIPSKVYDGTRTCPLAGATFTGVLSGDVVTLDQTVMTATFADKHVASPSAKSVTISGNQLAGAQAANYVLASTSGITAAITPKPLTVVATGVNKVFDGNTNATVTLAAVAPGVISGDVIDLGYTSATFADALVGDNKPVTVSGVFLRPSTDQNNYSISNPAPTTTANITANPLPVTLVSFAGKYSNSTGVTLNWSTATEINNDFFQVERSLDGKTFVSVGKVKGNGNSSTLIKYQFVDAQAPAGTVYYRLRQVDFDGKFELSKVIAVSAQGGSLAIGVVKAYPNPTFTGKVSLEAGKGQGGSAIITLLNGNGQIISKQETVLVEGQPYELDLTQQKAGMYYLQVENGAGRSSSRIVKQ
jgi:hypothetical protein